MLMKNQCRITALLMMLTRKKCSVRLLSLRRKILTRIKNISDNKTIIVMPSGAVRCAQIQLVNFERNTYGQTSAVRAIILLCRSNALQQKSLCV